MKRKRSLFLIGSVLVLCFGLAGCTKEKMTSFFNIETVTSQSIKNGEATVVVSTPYGNSKDDGVAVIYEDKRISTLQLQIDMYNFDDSKPSHVYVDGTLKEKGVFGSLTTTTVTLEGNDLKIGKHKITVMQFEDDSASGTPLINKSVFYEMKIKKER